jgi:hypothetical protein
MVTGFCEKGPSVKHGMFGIYEFGGGTAAERNAFSVLIENR